jgi:hypothetical protein
MEIVSEETTQVGSWGDLRVGDRVRVKFNDPLPGPFVIVEIRVDDILGSGRKGAVAVVRDASDALYTVSVGRLEKV